MPEIPESVRIGLQNIRPTLDLRWNPKGRLTKPGHYAVAGFDPPEYDPRWELWDVDSEGKPYRIMVVERVDGSFKPVGDWLVERVRFVNPERWGGDPNKMIAALIEMEEERRETLMDRDFETLAEATASWGGWLITPKSYNPANTRGGEWSLGVVEPDSHFEAAAAGASPARPGSPILAPE